MDSEPNGEAPKKRGRGRPPKPKDVVVAQREEIEQKREERRREADTKNAIWRLTPAELRFAEVKASGGTNEEAVKAAGYRGDSGRAKARAHRMMKKPNVRAAVYTLAKNAFAASGVTVETLLQEFAYLAFMPDDMLEGKPTYTHKIRALERLGEHVKMFNAGSEGAPLTLIQMIVKAQKAGKLIEQAPAELPEDSP